ncbi:outer membrane beta-barrel protein [Rhodoferax aquaticus]|uniref:Outer membrane protein OmpA-like transmembrane domain-containing protein n=1 Tax=Rhodoferax aquaticus TaxID=2527691 RepID=A0A515ELQ8_9BURK|nr:outer membrane beta-barrel protein [Rhodoferax aquaticus]QDL53592.1 hypothetical protein EXZ61_05040 [Rhodoferax aquaticus]
MSAGRFFGGLAISENFGAELGYITTSTASATVSGVSRSAVAYSLSATTKTNGVDYSALIRPSHSTGLNGLFIRIGGHTLSTQTDVSGVIGGVSGIESKTTSGSGALFGMGYDAKITEALGVRVAYTSYNSVSGLSNNDVSLLSAGLVAKF